MALTLMQHGWADVRPLLGGFDAWRNAGYPTEPKSARAESFSEVGQKVRKRR